MAQCLNKQAVLLMLLPGWRIQHHQIRQRDRKEIGLRNLVAMGLHPLKKSLEVARRRRAFAQLPQSHSLPEQIIGRLIVVIAPGIKSRASLRRPFKAALRLGMRIAACVAVAQQVPDIVIGLPRQTSLPEVVWIAQRRLQQGNRLAELATGNML